MPLTNNTCLPCLLAFFPRSSSAHRNQVLSDAFSRLASDAAGPDAATNPTVIEPETPGEEALEMLDRPSSILSLPSAGAREGREEGTMRGAHGGASGGYGGATAGSGFPAIPKLGRGRELGVSLGGEFYRGAWARGQAGGWRDHPNGQLKRALRGIQKMAWAIVASLFLLSSPFCNGMVASTLVAVRVVRLDRAHRATKERSNAPATRSEGQVWRIPGRSRLVSFLTRLAYKHLSKKSANRRHFGDA